MEWHCIIRPHLSRALGECDLSRDALLMVLFALHHTLPEQADRFRRTGDTGSAGFLFPISGQRARRRVVASPDVRRGRRDSTRLSFRGKRGARDEAPRSVRSRCGRPPAGGRISSAIPCFRGPPVPRRWRRPWMGREAWRQATGGHMSDRQQQLLQLIENAFRGVELGDGVGLRETVVIDNYGGDDARRAARAGDEKHDWRKLIEDADLVRICGVGGLSFYDATGLRFHMPAYLSLAVTDFDRDEASDAPASLLFHLTDLSDYNLKRFSILDEAQKRCVAEVLVYLRDEFEVGHPGFDQAIQRYWNPGVRE